MSIKEAMGGTPVHKLEARTMAESIHKNEPEVQKEMLEEVKAHLIKLNQKNVEQLKEI